MKACRSGAEEVQLRLCGQGVGWGFTARFGFRSPMVLRLLWAQVGRSAWSFELVPFGPGHSMGLPSAGPPTPHSAEAATAGLVPSHPLPLPTPIP